MQILGSSSAIHRSSPSSVTIEGEESPSKKPSMAGMVQDEGSSSVSSSPLQFFSLMTLSPGLGSPYPWLRELKSEERGLCLIQLLLSCANHVSAGSLENANLCLEQISLLASPDGDSMQRMASYFTEALAGRILKPWPGIYKALNSTRISSVAESVLARRLFFDLCPFLKLSYIVANQAILESMEGEKMVHVIDLNSAEPVQWIALLQALSARPEGPPHLRITGIHDQKEVLDQTALRLTEEAEKLDIPFQFNPIVSKLESLDIESLKVKTGEALAISSILQLHSMLAIDNDNPRRTPTKNPMQRVIQMNQHTLGELMEKDPANGFSLDSSSSLLLMDGFLGSLWGLSPKIMVVAEQESNHNGSTLMERLLEALYFYAALFDCLESTISRASMDRMKVEKMLFGEEIKNIIACEGSERKERHEKLERWIQRLDFAGFGRVPLSYYGVLQATRLLQTYSCDGYKIREENGCMVICWQDRPLFSVSAWRCRRGQMIVLLLYVDDIILTGSSSTLIQTVVKDLQSKFAMKDLGCLHYFLGMQAQFTPQGLFLSQHKYALEILQKSNMTDAKPVATPINTKQQLSSHEGELLVDPTEYRQLVGSLQYLTFTRPDIAYAVNAVSQFMHAPRNSHLMAVKRILRYIKGTVDQGLMLYKDSNLLLNAYSDADWAGCPDSRRSTTGYCIFLGHSLISWAAKKQPTVSRSSAESEYRSLAYAVAETIWLQHQCHIESNLPCQLLLCITPIVKRCLSFSLKTSYCVLRQHQCHISHIESNLPCQN